MALSAAGEAHSLDFPGTVPGAGGPPRSN